MRVIVFGSITLHYGMSAIVKALSPFAIVKEVNWKYNSIPEGAFYLWLKFFYRAIEYAYWFLRTFKEIHQFQADVIISQYVYSTGIIGIAVAGLSRKPCIVRAVGSDLKIDSQSILGKGLVCWTLRNARGVICVSKDLENIAKTLGARNTVIIPSPLDLSGFHKKDIPRKDLEIISVASLTQVKGIQYLIKSMKHITDHKLVIIGDGPERKKLESLSQNLGLSNRILFLGQIDHNMVFHSLQRAMVFVLPSISEGTPRALIEAMAFGLPIVATRVGGIPEVVEDGVNGFLVSPRDEKALTKAIKRVLKDNDFRKKVSNLNPQVAKKYSMATVGKKMYNYLRTITQDATE